MGKTIFKPFIVLIFFLSFFINQTIDLFSQVRQQWAVRYNANVSNQGEVIAIDSSGNIYISGSDGGSPAGFSIVKYNNNGVLLW